MLKQMGSITESIGVLECLSKPLNVFQDLSHSLQPKAMRKIPSMASIFLSFQVLSIKKAPDGRYLGQSQGHLKFLMTM